MKEKPWYFNFTMETFVALESNRAARELAAQALRPPSAGLLGAIASSSGNGGTHLLGAVVNKVNADSREELVRLLSAESLQNILKNPPAEGRLVAIDSLHSLRGSGPDLQQFRDMTLGARDSGCTVLFTVDVAMKEEILELWPEIRWAEILNPSPGDRFKVLLEFQRSLSVEVPKTILVEIAEKTRNVREGIGAMIRYEACVTIGVPYSFE